MAFETKRKNNHQSENLQDFPCLKEKQQSLHCLDRNNYDYSKCQVAFDNFKFCRQFWDKVAVTRKLQKIEPAMPNGEERTKIQAHFKATGKIPDFKPK